MPIQLPKGLPAQRQLFREGVVALAAPQRRAAQPRPGQRRLRIALLNLMPAKAVTETQLARLLGSTPHLVELSLLVPASYRAKTADPEHLKSFYRSWPSVRGQSFDGLIVTGAPVETLPFEEVDYWPELTEILDWSQQAVGGSYLICWAAQAALYHWHGVPKHDLPEKAFGVFPHRLRAPGAALMQGFPARFPVPVSRRSETRAENLPASGAVQVLVESEESGLCLLQETERRAVYMFNHLEYDADTLPDEYRRDLAAGLPIRPPRNAFPQDDPARPPLNGWQPYGLRLFRNWLDGLAAQAGRTARPRLARTAAAE
ncbi:MAG: homoserine O-succinyltransferase [Kiloniellales bacterium]